VSTAEESIGAKIEYYYWEWFDRREGCLVIEGHVGIADFAADNRASSARIME